MDIKQHFFVVINTVLICSIAKASDMGPMALFQGLRPIVALQGGYASMNPGGNTQHFTGTDSNVFTFNNFGSGKNTGLIGVFLGAEPALPLISRSGLFMQTGIEYNYFGKVGVNGINTVGVEPQTSTTYHYNYNFQTQQVLGTLRLFVTTYERFLPYGEVGLGAAFNHAGQYNATTTETGSINLTPGFSSQNQTQFSYSLGLGVDIQVNTQVRMGFGYRYSNFGSASLGNCIVTSNNYQSPLQFALGSSSIHTNQLIARLSYAV